MIEQASKMSRNEVRRLQAAAERGDAQAQFVLANLYFRGNGVEQDTAKALRLLGQAADQGLAKAQLILASFYALGDGGVEQDMAKSMRLIGQAVEQGDAEAQSALAQNYASGYGVEVDTAKAAQLYEGSRWTCRPPGAGGQAG
jgi:TPR repeat protein